MEVNAAQFRWNCCKILDQIKLTRGEVIITKRGKPIAKLMHISQERYRDPLLGSMEGTVRVNALGGCCLSMRYILHH